MSIWGFFRFESELADDYTQARLSHLCILLLLHIKPDWRPKPGKPYLYSVVKALSVIDLDSFNMSFQQAADFHHDLKKLKQDLRLLHKAKMKRAKNIIYQITMSYDFDGDRAAMYEYNLYPDV
jgi:hypothetical protein